MSLDLGLALALFKTKPQIIRLILKYLEDFKQDNTIYANTYYVNDDYRTVQDTIDTAIAESTSSNAFAQHVVLSPGSFADSDIDLTGVENFALTAQSVHPVSPHTEIGTSGTNRNVLIAGSSSTRVKLADFSIKGDLNIDGTLGRHALYHMTVSGSVNFTNATQNFMLFYDSTIGGMSTDAAFPGLVYLVRCDLSNGTYNFLHASDLQVVLVDCTNIPTGLTKVTYAGQNYFADGTSRTDSSEYYVNGDPLALRHLYDVTDVGKQDNYVLIYDETTGVWSPGSAADIAGAYTTETFNKDLSESSIADLRDVEYTPPEGTFSPAEATADNKQYIPVVDGLTTFAVSSDGTALYYNRTLDPNTGIYDVAAATIGIPFEIDTVITNPGGALNYLFKFVTDIQVKDNDTRIYVLDSDKILSQHDIDPADKTEINPTPVTTIDLTTLPGSVDYGAESSSAFPTEAKITAVSDAVFDMAEDGDDAGKKLWIWDPLGQVIKTYDMQARWTVAPGSLSLSPTDFFDWPLIPGFSPPGGDVVAKSIEVTNEGKTLLISDVGPSGNIAVIHEFALATPYSVTTSNATYVATTSFSTRIDGLTSARLGPNGGRFYISDSAEPSIEQYSTTASGTVNGDILIYDNSVPGFKSISPTTDIINEGDVNLYFTEERAANAAQNAFNYGTGINFDSATDTISIGQSVETTDDVTFNSVTLGEDPDQPSEAATKRYVDEVAQGLRAVPAAKAATTADLGGTYDFANKTITIPATATLDIDGVTTWAVGDNILVKDQTNPEENGPYTITQLGDGTTDWILTRPDFDDEASEIPGSFEFITSGNLYANTGWVMVVDDPDTYVVGTDPVYVNQFYGAGTYTAGNGLELTGTQFSVDNGTNLEFDGTGKIQTTPDISLEVASFDTSATIDPAPGQLTWDPDSNTLVAGLDTDVKLQIGQETHVNVKAAETITNGDVVYASGAVGNSGKIEVSKFTADNNISSKRVMGIATQDIASGDFGFVSTFGVVRGISTDGSTAGETWVDGDILYASPTTPGGLTKVEPTAPNQDIPIAFVVSANGGNGALFVRAYELGYNLTELHDVNTTGVTDGDVIVYDGSSGVWVPASGPSEQIDEFQKNETIYNRTYYVNDGHIDIQDAVDQAKADSGSGNARLRHLIVSPGSFAASGTPLDLSDVENFAITGPLTHPASQHVEIGTGGTTRDVNLSGASSTRVKLSHLTINGDLNINGTLGRHVLYNMAIRGSINFTNGAQNFYTFTDSTIDGISADATFAGVLYLIRCDLQNGVHNFNQASPLQIIVADCSNIPAGLTNVTYVGQNYFADGTVRTDSSEYYVNGQLFSMNDLADADTTTTAPTNGQVLVYDGTNWVPGNKVNNLDDLLDVNSSGATDGQVLVYDAATSEWVPSDKVNEISDLSDVSVTSVSDGEFLVYDAAASEWVNQLVHDGVATYDSTIDYSANAVIVKDYKLYISNDAVPAGTTFVEGETGATWRLLSAGGGGVQPVVNDLDAASGTTQLVTDEFNWFNVSPIDDVTLDFVLTEQEEAKFDLVWDNKSISGTTQYDVESGVYDNVTLDVSSEESIPFGIDISDDGTKLFVIGDSNEDIYSYTLSTPYDIGTATYDNVSFDTSNETNSPCGVKFINSGTKAFVIDESTASVYSYSLTTPYDIGTATYDNVSFDVSSQAPSPQAIDVSPDGTKMIITDNDNDSVSSYTLSTPYDLNTAAFDGNTVSLPGVAPFGIRFNDDGTKLFHLDQGSQGVYTHTLSTPFDLSTITTSNTVALSVASNASFPTDMTFSSNGKKLYITDLVSTSVVQYSVEGSTGSATEPALTLPNSIEWKSGVEPTLSPVGQKDWFRFETKDGGQTWLGEKVYPVPETSSGGAEAIGDLTDVTIDSDGVAEGEILAYNPDNSAFEPAPVLKSIQLIQPGELTVTAGVARWYFSTKSEIRNVTAYLNEASIGTTNVSVTLRLNNTSDVVTLNFVDGQLKSTSGSISELVTADDYLTVNINSVGNSQPGNYLHLKIDYVILEHQV